MKRSEMIWDIASEIILADTSINYKLAQEIAENILDMQESVGMLPPCLDEGDYNHLIDHKGGTYCQNIWEAEDLTNE